MGIHLLFGLMAATGLYLLVYWIAQIRWERSKARDARPMFIYAGWIQPARPSRRRGRRARRWISAGMGMAVLASMWMPAPADANEFNLADRLLKNLSALNRMQTQGAAILIPAELRRAHEAHERAMRHARSIVKLRAFQATLRERKETARGGVRMKTLNSLNRWARLEVIEHDSAGVAVCEEVDAVAQRFAILRQVRWMLRQNGYDAPDLTGPEVSGAFRGRVEAVAASVKEITGAFKRMAAGDEGRWDNDDFRRSARIRVKTAALRVHRSDRPDLYPLTASRR
ncbi:MAG: hypothetical protein QGF68_02270 [Nitrospinota bacterium]|nr:hypothetical protein [Nitrospinota bacterium]